MSQVNTKTQVILARLIAIVFKDPATAHGITDALRDGKLLADAILVGTERALRNYQEIRDLVSIPFFEVTENVAALDWNLEEIQQLHLELHKIMQTERDVVLNGPRKMAA